MINPESTTRSPRDVSFLDEPAGEPEGGEYGPRIGCNGCFHTLDPGDSGGADRRAFVRCDRCRRLFHQVCWRNRCTRPGCDGASCSPVHVARPFPLRGGSSSGAPASDGAARLMGNGPLAISRGTLLLLDGRSQKVTIRNQSKDIVEVPRAIGPPWISVGVRVDSLTLEGHPDGPITGWVPLEPDEQVELFVRGHRFRPPWMREHAWLNDEQGIEILSEWTPAWLILGVFGLACLLIHHWYRFVRASAHIDFMSITWLAASAGLVAAWWTLLSPSRVRNALLWAIDSIGWNADASALAALVRGLAIPAESDDEARGGELAKRLILALLSGLWIATILWPIAMTVLLLLEASVVISTRISVLFLMAMLYGAAIAWFAHAGLRKYNVVLLGSARNKLRSVRRDLAEGGVGRLSDADRKMVILVAIFFVLALIGAYALINSIVSGQG